MRHYVVMTKDELGEDIRATQEEYEYHDFDENNELENRLFTAWSDELARLVKENLPSEYGAVWVERVDREAYRFNGFGECISDYDEDDEDYDSDFGDSDEMMPCDTSGLCGGSSCRYWHNCHIKKGILS